MLAIQCCACFTAGLRVYEEHQGVSTEIHRADHFDNASVSWNACVDGFRNGAETGVDCGGSAGCARCGQNVTCSDDSDCDGWVCLRDTAINANADVCTRAPGPSSIASSDWSVWPNGGGLGRFDNSEYRGYCTQIFGNDGSTRICPYEHGTFRVVPTRESRNHGVAMQLCKFESAWRAS